MRMLDDLKNIISKISIRELTLMSNNELSIVMQKLLKDYYAVNHNVFRIVNLKRR